MDEYRYVAAIAGNKAPCFSVGYKIVAVELRYFRPAVLDTLLGDPGKARQQSGWVPTTSLAKVGHEIMVHDLEQANRHSLLISNGLNVSVYQE